MEFVWHLYLQLSCFPTLLHMMSDLFCYLSAFPGCPPMQCASRGTPQAEPESLTTHSSGQTRRGVCEGPEAGCWMAESRTPQDLRWGTGGGNPNGRDGEKCCQKSTAWLLYLSGDFQVTDDSKVFMRRWDFCIEGCLDCEQQYYFARQCVVMKDVHL